MAVEFRFPDVGEGIHEGKLVKWLVAEGQAVKRDDALCEVETDKAVVELPAPADGIVLKRFVEEGTTINVGDVLVVIGAKGEGIPSATAKTPIPAQAIATIEEKTVARVPSAAPAENASYRTAQNGSPVLAHAGENARALPHTRKLARVLGIDISKVTGTGNGGRVTDADVQGFKEKGIPSVSFAPAKHGGETQTVEYGTIEVLPLSGVRKAVAEKLAWSWHSAVHVTLMDEVAVDELSQIREKEKARL
ncbi:MAG: biotin/lipoyl-containing protein, partial [Candidatus Diapherotrites archaeon]|nr:biotin/lipoyl-containing protein [Candidatus Diapherotrites archaeon]